MKILQLNCRLSGGAAQVAKQLHCHLNSASLPKAESTFAYGYGEKGGTDIRARSLGNVVRLTPRFVAISNFILHRCTGLEAFYTPKMSRILHDLFASHDIVHIHGAHTFYLPFETLMQALVETDVKVVITAHDFWFLTGRCGFVESCDGWRRGCGECGNSRTNYPPSHLDFSKSSHRKKRMALEKIADRLYIISPSKSLLNNFERSIPAVSYRHIPNGVAVTDLVSEDNSGPKLRALFAANDLSDDSKVDHQLLNLVAQIDNIQVVTIGKNSDMFDGVESHGYVSERLQYLNILRGCDVLIFASKKDIHPLVFLEALSVGLFVLALRSDASEEILSELGVDVYDSHQEIIQALTTGEWRKNYGRFQTRQELKETACDLFSEERMLNEYHRYYEEILKID
jgi:putative colanic acid biosynthesis glycosyltransferase